MNGRVTLQPTTTKSSAELVTRVKAHEYLNAMMNAASNRARDWKRMASLSDMLCWIVLDSVVMVFVTVPTETWSTLLIGWEKRAWTYSSRITADTRRPVTRKQNCNGEYISIVLFEVPTYHGEVCQAEFRYEQVHNVQTV